MNWEKPLKNMREQLGFYVKQNGLKSLVLGVSGGIDSALVAAIAKPVCDDLNIKLIGRSLPCTSNKEDEIFRADRVGVAFCHDFKTFYINEPVNTILGYSEADYSVHENNKFKTIAKGNIKARVRMIHLYDLAYRTHGMVLGTDNLTEKLVGFWTIAGDIGDWGLIQNLWKTEVYDLSQWIIFYELNGDAASFEALQTCVDAVPTDGLGISNSDLDQLGAPTYEEVDKILKTWLVEDIDSFSWDDAFFYAGRLEDYEAFSKYRESLKDHPVIQRHIKTEFKRLVPINLKRNQIFKFKDNSEELL
jgi:NAD+ synthetase